MPFHVFLHFSSPHFERERTWRRVAASFHEGTNHDYYPLFTILTGILGHCMITVGTGPEVRRQLIDSFTLLPAHCYAVVGTVLYLALPELCSKTL